VNFFLEGTFRNSILHNDTMLCITCETCHGQSFVAVLLTESNLLEESLPIRRDYATMPLKRSFN